MKQKSAVPAAIKVGGEKYIPTVLKVTDANADGTPRAFRFLAEDEPVTNDGGEVFVVYALPTMSLRRSTDG